MAKKSKKIAFCFGDKHKMYIRRCAENTFNFAEGAVRAGKTVDNVFAFAHELKTTPDKIHLATGSTMANAKLNIGDANGFGLEYIFRGQCHWGKYKDNEALFIKGPSTGQRLRIILFSGGAKADSYKKIRGNSYGMWIATEINLHHQDTIREAFNRQLAAQRRKVFWDLNPDNPNAPIYTEYIDLYRQRAEAGELLGGCNYEHFTIDDNVTISDQRKAEIKSQYDPNSIWYMRDILGRRMVAEGLIYRQFAESCERKDGFFFTPDKPKNIMEINVGVDFGGGGSAHAFVATAITRGYQNAVVLSAQRIECKNRDIDPDQLGKLFIDFCLAIINRFGYITNVYCDNAEQTLIAGLRTSARKSGLSWLRITDALKTAINDRINLTTRLMVMGRLQLMEGYCDTLAGAFCSAVWNPKNLTENERLDDGTSDIDSLDAFEYTIERSISRFIRYE